MCSEVHTVKPSKTEINQFALATMCIELSLITHANIHYYICINKHNTQDVLKTFFKPGNIVIQLVKPPGKHKVPYFE